LPRFSGAEDMEAEEEAPRAGAVSDAHHRDALFAFYAAKRAEFANEGKVAELWRTVGPSVWLRLAEKYGAVDVVAVLLDKGAWLPQEEAYAGLNKSLAAGRKRDAELRAAEAGQRVT